MQSPDYRVDLTPHYRGTSRRLQGEAVRTGPDAGAAPRSFSPSAMARLRRLLHFETNPYFFDGANLIT